MKLKGRRFEAVSDIQRESQAALDSIEENVFLGAFGAWKKTVGSLHMFQREPNLSKLSQHFFVGLGT
jgi:hypothetical protein